MAAAKKKQRTPAQIAATKRMLAARKANRAGSTSKKTPSRATRPGTPKTPQVNVRVTAPAAAPAPAKKPSKAKAAAARARTVAGKGMKVGKELLSDVVLPSAVGAVAASGVDVAYGFARKWLPEKIVNSPAKHVIKAGTGIGLCLLAQKFGAPAHHCKNAAIVISGVNLHRAINEQVEGRVKVNLNGLAMTMGEVSAILPVDEELNGLESLGALAAGDAELGAVLPFIQNAA